MDIVQVKYHEGSAFGVRQKGKFQFLKISLYI